MGNREFRRCTDGARLLLVEDNEDYCSLMNLTLREAGYAVDCATCAEDGMRMLEAQRYDLVLSDYSLPGCSGVWLLSRAIERNLMAADAAVLVTGDPDAPGITDSISVVTKPVDFDRFLRQVRTMLAQSLVRGTFNGGITSSFKSATCRLSVDDRRLIPIPLTHFS